MTPHARQVEQTQHLFIYFNNDILHNNEGCDLVHPKNIFLSSFTQPHDVRCYLNIYLYIFKCFSQ